MAKQAFPTRIVRNIKNQLARRLVSARNTTGKTGAHCGIRRFMCKERLCGDVGGIAE